MASRGNTGGIFSGPNALGLSAFGGMASCQPDNTALVRKVQSWLQQNGAPKVHVDGQWQGCTASAYRKVTGQIYVTPADMTKMTGETCSSDDAPLGVLTGFTLQGLTPCMDGSDGVGTGAPPAAGACVPQACPAGQSWNQMLCMCVLDALNVFGGGGGTSPPHGGGAQPAAAGSCPPGQFGIPPFCIGTATGGGGTTAGAAVGGPPTECAQGMIKNPMDGLCAGAAGIGLQPTECAQGMFKDPILNKCWPSFGGSTAQPAAGGACPAGTFGFPPLCIGTPTATQPGAQPGNPITGLLGGIASMFGNLMGQGQTCPAGTVFNALTGQCTGVGGSVPPGTQVVPGTLTPVPVTGAPWYTSNIAIGAMAIGVTAAAWYAWKKHKEGQMGDTGGISDAEIEAMFAGDDSMFAGVSGMGDFGGGQFAYPNRGRGKGRRRHGRRRGRR